MSTSKVKACIKSPYTTVKLPFPAIYELSGNACKIYSLMRYRMTLSIDGKKYYNYKKGFYYIIYPNNELNKITNLKKGSFYKAIRELKQKNYINKISTKRESVIRLPKAEHYYKPRFNLKPRASSNNKVDSPYIKVGSSKYKPNSSHIEPRNRTNINNQNKNQYKNQDNIYMNSFKNKFFETVESTSKSLGLTLDSLKTISGFSRDYDEYKAIINKLFTVTNIKRNKIYSIKKKMGYSFDEKLLKFKTSPYFNSDMFIRDIDNIFYQIDYNTRHNNKTPNRNHYGGYLVSNLTWNIIEYLEYHHYVKKQKRLKKQNTEKDREISQEETKSKDNHEDLKIKSSDIFGSNKPKQQKDTKLRPIKHSNFDVTNMEGDYPRVNSCDQYTVINSRLPDEQEIVTDFNGVAELPMKLGSLRKQYKSKESDSVNQSMMKSIDKFISDNLESYSSTQSTDKTESYRYKGAYTNSINPFVDPKKVVLPKD